MTRARRASVSGMTLLELVVGLTVTGVALTAGFGALSLIGDRREQALQAVNAVARAAAQREALTSWVAGARLMPDESGPQFRGLDGAAGEIPDDDVTLLTTAATPLGQGETLMRLYVDRDSATPERGLTAAFAAWTGHRGPGTALRVALDSSVAGLDVRYVTGLRGRREWLPGWVSSTVLPAGVELRFVARAADSLPPLLGLPILVPLRGGR